MSPIADPITTLINLGVIGIILVLALLGWIRFKPENDRLLEDKAAAEKQRDDLIATYQEQVIPALNAVAHDVLPALLAAQKQGEVAAAEFQRLRDALGRDHR